MARHRRQRCASRRAPMGAVDERIHRGAGSGASTDVLRDWRPAPRDRRGVGRLPSRSALIWRTTRSRTGGAGAIETLTLGAVPDFIPVVGRCRTTRYSLLHSAFHSTWNECRRHLGLAGRLQPSRHLESGAMRTACSLSGHPESTGSARSARSARSIWRRWGIPPQQSFIFAPLPPMTSSARSWR